MYPHPRGTSFALPKGHPLSTTQTRQKRTRQLHPSRPVPNFIHPRLPHAKELGRSERGVRAYTHARGHHVGSARTASIARACVCEEVSWAVGVLGRENMCEGKCLCSGTRASSVEREGTVVDFHQTKACCGWSLLEPLRKEETQ